MEIIENELSFSRNNNDTEYRECTFRHHNFRTRIQILNCTRVRNLAHLLPSVVVTPKWKHSVMSTAQNQTKFYCLCPKSHNHQHFLPKSREEPLVHLPHCLCPFTTRSSYLLPPCPSTNIISAMAQSVATCPPQGLCYDNLNQSCIRYPYSHPNVITSMEPYCLYHDSAVFTNHLTPRI